MKANQLLLKGARLLVGVFFAYLVGLLSGKIYSEVANKPIINVDESLVDDYFIAENNESVDYDYIVKNDVNVYTIDIFNGLWMNTNIIGCQQYIAMNSKEEAQRSVEKPNLPPPRDGLARSDTVDTS